MDTRSPIADPLTHQPGRVVINGRFLAQPQTGVQRYARETLLALDRLLVEGSAGLPAGVRVQLAVPRGTGALPLHAIETVVLPRGQGHWWEQTSLAWFARGAALLGFSYSGPLFKRRQLITVHDATVAVMPGSFTARYRHFHNLLLALLRRRVQTVMTVSGFSQAEIATHYKVRHSVVGREGWEHSVAHGDERAVLQRHGLASGGYVFVVSSLKQNKNLGLLPRALQLLPRLPWTIAVAGAADARIFPRTDGLPSSIRLLGFVDDADLGVLYKHAAWFVLPSLYEGFGLPAIEAMANGCPVLAARAGSLPEVCGDAALYFDPRLPASLAQVLGRVASQPGLREAMVARHAERLAHYTWRHNALIVGRELRRLIEGPHAGAVAQPDLAETRLEGAAP